MSSTEYRANTRDIKFILHEMLNIKDTLLKRETFQDFEADDINMIIDEAAKFAETVLGPINKEGDKQGCRFEKGKVSIPQAYHQPYKQFCENGWNAVSAPAEVGGQGLPFMMSVAAMEMFDGACTSLMIYSGLTFSAANLVKSFGDEDMKRKYMEKMFSGQWAGTMQLTEPNAGSAIADTKTSAKKAGEHYLISGTKIFISGAEQDLTENIVHMVLARVEGAPPGIKGISLFLVSKYHVNDDGSLGEPNDINCGGIEEKIGLHGSSTCLVNLGENNTCHGYLLGQENEGIRLMFQMMNESRIATSRQGMALAAGAYENCLSYAKERIQGIAVEDGRNPDAQNVEIIKHPDVRRMLLTQKAYVEGMRAMLQYCAYHIDMAETAADKEEHSEHFQLVELLTPICKAYCTDYGFKVCEMAVQTMGGYGCTQDYPVEQYLRDIKPTSIYEGTNGIQAMDLLGRKVTMKGGALFKNFIALVTEFGAKHQDHTELKDLVSSFISAKDKLVEVTGHLAEIGKSGDQKYYVLSATPYYHIFGDLVIAYMLLWQAIVAQEKFNALDKKPEENAEAAFYSGKIMNARFFINNILPHVHSYVVGITNGDRSSLEIAEEAF